jgi:hypothetical protein
MTRSLARTIAVVALAGAAALATSASADPVPVAPAELVGRPQLVLAPEIGRNYATVMFRTDRPIARRDNGGIQGRAAVERHSSSLGSIRGARGKPCYVAYFRGDVQDGRRATRFRVGGRYDAEIQIEEQPALQRTLKLRAERKGDVKGRALGC